MSEPGIQVKDLRLLGGRLCIDFVNTIENRAGARPEDAITSCAQLAHWARHAGILAESDVARLLAHTGEHSSEAERTLTQAIHLRETLHRALLAIAKRHDPRPGDLREIEIAYQRAVAHAGLTPDGTKFSWGWRTAAPQLEQVLWPVAFSAVELLTAGELRRVKVCANPHGCGWLFYDNSKNASRRWCSMEGCGSQVKMRRQYAKRRSAAANGDGR